MSDHLKNGGVWLIGAGEMAVSYAAVLKAQEIPFKVIGRSGRNAQCFYERTGCRVQAGGLNCWLKTGPPLPKAVIVAAGVEELKDVTIELLKYGVSRILVEKPGGLYLEDLKEMAAETEIRNAEVYVAYNRRFYSSTLKLSECLKEDGGLLSFHFEFTEWGHVIEKLQKSPDIKARWFLANSTHVVDLAFFLGGKPSKMTCYHSGGLSWHPSASIYAGSGMTNSGALFSYHANWNAPGRWGIEILTEKRRFILRPLESLYVQKINSLDIERIDLNDELDKQFKPGLFRQVEAFLNEHSDGSLLSIAEQLCNTERIFMFINPYERSFNEK